MACALEFSGPLELRYWLMELSFQEQLPLLSLSCYFAIA